MSSTGILVAHYLQSITPSLALGGELVYHRRPGEEGTVMSLAGKYTSEWGAGTASQGCGRARVSVSASGSQAPRTLLLSS